MITQTAPEPSRGTAYVKWRATHFREAMSFPSVQAARDIPPVSQNRLSAAAPAAGSVGRACAAWLCTSSLNGRGLRREGRSPLVMRDFPRQHLETGAWGGLGPQEPGFLLTPSSPSVQTKRFSCPHTVPPQPQGGTVRESRGPRLPATYTRQALAALP